MAHELAGAFQETMWMRNLGPTKKTDIDVSPERIDISKCRVTNARGRMTVMRQLSNIVSAGTDDLEPPPSDISQLVPMPVHPDFDRRISFHRARQPKESNHADFTLVLTQNAKARGNMSDLTYKA
jgi:hypothetical protein